MSDTNTKKRIGVLASGGGTNFQALADACQSGEINGEVVALISNNRFAPALSRARAMNVEALFFDPQKFTSKTIFCSKIARALKDRDVELVCLAGYMMKLEACIIRGFPNRILNIHPALLPKFGGKGMYGRHVHQAVIQAQETESGCTVHLVNDVYDAGPILAQARVPVQPDDTAETLAQRIYSEEHKLYVRVVKDICEGTLDLDSFPSTLPPLKKKGTSV